MSNVYIGKYVPYGYTKIQFGVYNNFRTFGDFIEFLNVTGNDIYTYDKYILERSRDTHEIFVKNADVSRFTDHVPKYTFYFKRDDFDTDILYKVIDNFRSMVPHEDGFILYQPKSAVSMVIFDVELAIRFMLENDEVIMDSRCKE